MALANIVLADAQATPVNHTFVPTGADANGVLWWEDQSASSPIGYWKVSVEIKKPGLPSAGEASVATGRVNRVKVGLHMPVLENVTNSTVSGIIPAPTVSYVCRATGGEYILPERATLQNKKDLRKMYALLLAEAQVVNLMENGVKPY